MTFTRKNSGGIAFLLNSHRVSGTVAGFRIAASGDEEI